jgi:hypothetical protein
VVEQFVLADLYDIAFDEIVVLDAPRTHEYSVCAVEILDDGSLRTRNDLRMVARYEFAPNLQIVVGRSADDRSTERDRKIRDDLVAKQHVESREM